MIPAALPSHLGEFRVDAILGEGGSGIVYDATWGPRRVALKVLHPSLADTQRVRAQFFSEAERLKTITHPSVVKVLAVGELPDRRPYLAMERLDGETLASVLGRGALALAPALELFGELCDAVATLHAQGVIHRDLKPENVFVVDGKDGKHAVLLDFGIAKQVAAPDSTTTMDGGVRGTPAYMAPERFFGQAAGTATDVYELAVILYAMLAGRLPWDDVGDPEARLSPRPLVEQVAIPEDLDIEIRRALSTRAQNRPATATALFEAVRASSGGTAPGPALGETARMRPATKQPIGATVTAERRPRVAERQHTTDRGKTPLAWAPSQLAREPAPEPESPRARRWWFAGVAAVALLAGGLVLWRFAGDDAAPRRTAQPTASPPITPTVAPAADPWGERPPAAPAQELTPHGPEVPISTAQGELVAALRHLPADTSFVIAATVGHLRRDPRFEALFAKLATHPQVTDLMAVVPPCVTTLIAGSEWFVFGSAGFQASTQGTLILRGRWNRADVEGCFMGQYETLAMTDGTELLQLPHLGWIDFLDDHTAYISVRQDLAAAQVHANVERGAGLTAHARALLATLPAERMLTFVVDGTGGVRWPGDPLPAGSDAALWVRTTDPGLSLELALDVKTAAEAKKLEATLGPELEALFPTSSGPGGKLEVRRKRSQVRVTGELSTVVIGMLSAALSQ